MKTNKFALIGLLSLAVVSGCTKEESGLLSVGHSIRPVLTSWEASGTRTKSVSEQESGDGRQIAVIPIYENPGDSLYMIVYEKDMPEMLPDGPSTKGTEATTANLSSFRMKAYAREDWHDNETGASHQAGPYFSAIGVSKTNGEWTPATEYKWLNAVPLSFWSWNEVEPVITAANGYDKATFSYTVQSTVTSQKDLIFAYNGENVTFDNSGAITDHSSTNADYNRTDEQLDIHFYHALSAIKFDISGVEEATVDKITLGGIYPGGDCAVSVPATGTDAGVPQFAWTVTGTPTSWSQTFASTDFDSDGKQVSGGDKEFLMIPQALTDASTLMVTFSGTDSTPKSIKGTGVTWQPGKYYTYKLSKTAFTWNYSFSGAAEWTFKSNRDGQESKSFTISSYRQRSDDATKREYVSWKIKSYKIGNGSEVPVNASSLDFDPTWIKASSTYKQKPLYYDTLAVTAKQIDSLAKGQHDYWYNTTGRTDDLGWSPADWSGKGTIDLSKLDVYSDEFNDQLPRTTSNCYIVRHAGTYKFPLVYGNAIANGAANKKSYDTSSHTGRSNALAVFVNHKGNQIENEFIENNSECIASRAELLGESEINNVTNVSLVGDRPPAPTPKKPTPVNATNVRYVQFTVSQNTIAQNNAIIAIKDDRGDVIWSWHIWITNNPDVVASPIEVTNWDSKKYSFLPANNIGNMDYAYYISRKDEDIVLTLEQDSPSTKTLKVTLKQQDFEMRTSALIYEWGRKDPFINKSEDLSGNTFNYVVDPDNTISSGIKYPMTWYGSSSTRAWTSLYANLWTGIESLEQPEDNCIVEKSDRTIKTIYDPSPVGYMVPPTGAFSGFNTLKGNFYGSTSFNPDSNWNVASEKDKNGKYIFDNGYVFYTSLGPNHTVNTGGPTIRFHSDGIRAGNGGGYIEDRGWYYTSILKTRSGNAACYSFMVESNYFTPCCSANTANGQCIRPIMEQ